MTHRPSLSIYAKVERDLHVISETMVRATAFKAVAGWGWVAMGLVGCGGAWIASARPQTPAWLSAWLITAALALTLGLTATQRSAARRGLRLDSAPARRFWTLLLPPLGAAAVLTLVFAMRGAWDLLPGSWLLLYGLGLLSGGSLCRSTVRNAGLAFQFLGLLAFAWPAGGDLCLAAGFGGIHIAAGLWMASHDEP